MPRQDLDNRSDLGTFRNKYDRDLTSQKTTVRLFADDNEKIKQMAIDRGISPTELIRLIISEYLLSNE
jgi:predicted DNA binding CopG/RHH family protein